MNTLLEINFFFTYWKNVITFSVGNFDSAACNIMFDMSFSVYFSILFPVKDSLKLNR